MNRRRYSVLALIVLVPCLASSSRAQCALNKFTASDGASTDLFGAAVAISGDAAIAGAYQDDDGGNSSGSAYVFERGAAGWGQVAKIVAGDAFVSDQFGLSVAMDGDVAVVGAPNGYAPAMRAGKAYVFERAGPGSPWVETVRLLASDRSCADRFGWSVAVSGNVVVVGAYFDDDAGTAATTDSGSAYVFERTGPGAPWLETAKLVASDTTAGDYFGEAVAVFGDSILIGARRDDDAGSNSGSVYLFERTGAAAPWVEITKLTASDASTGDEFGFSVAVDGDVAAIGAHNDSLTAPVGTNFGSTYVFERTAPGAAWSEATKLTASDMTAQDYFGTSVSVSGDRLVVGAFEDGGFPFSSVLGRLYVFGRTGPGAVWSEASKLQPSDGAGGDGFGKTVSLSGAGLAVGSYADDDLGSNSGSLYLYRVDDGRALFGCPEDVSVSAGGTQTLALDAGLTHAGMLYLLAGTVSGTAPGIPIHGLVVPLNLDAYLLFTITSPNTPPLSGSTANLDPNGQAAAQFSLPAGSSASLVGIVAHHAFAAIDVFAPSGPTAVFVSNAERVTLIP